MSSWRRSGIAVAAVVLTCALLSCTGSRPAAAPARPAHQAQTAQRAGPALALQVMPAPYQLPAAVSREVVLPAAGGLLIAGGLSLGGQILVAGGSRTVYRFDPATHRIVWQYGHTARAGRGAGYLSDPDGVDLVPPDSLLITHAATMGQP